MSERLPVTFTARANRHVEQASAWWTRNRTKAPLAIAEDLEEAIQLISSNPFIGALARDVELAGVRRVFLNRVGYYIYYRAQGEPPHSVQIVAFWHARRVSGPKL